MPSFVACGSRGNTIDRFKTAHANRSIEELPVLLVDSETPVTHGNPWKHLESVSAKWKQPTGATEDQAQLMVRCMEAWLLADRVPTMTDIESRSPSDLLAAMRSATNNKYSKGTQSFQLLATVDPSKLERLRYAKRFLDFLRANCT